MGSPVKMEDYTVGWVCALPLEMAAAKGMLDEVHPNPADQDPADHNSYALGVIQGHNVAIACLPAGVYGTTSAATVAKDLLRSFRSIRFGLMVGIGGGAPSEEQDIRLGDVIASQPTGTSGGVIQYGRGKALQEGGFERTGSLNAPPQILLTALSGLQANHLCGQGSVPQFLSDFAVRNPKMTARFGYQGAANDVLFRTEYDHGDSGPTCGRCDDTQTIRRATRDDTDPIIHYGTIASGDQVIKDGRRRDQLRRELNVLCFETEAAGLMQDFPCLVIRGVSDYADSHKNNKWQNYAAVTAAAFAKELLSVIPPARVLQQGPVPQIVSDPVLHNLVTTTTEAITAQTCHQETQYKSKAEARCHQSFKTSQYEKFKNINPDRVEGTCRWVLEHPHYRRWQDSPGDDLLWISADPGCGKSVLARSLVERELRAQNHTVCHFFFKDNEEQDTLSTALCALLHQLFSSQPQLLKHAMDPYNKNGEELQTEAAELWRILIAASKEDDQVKTANSTDEGTKTIICVLDALDECARADRRMLIERLNDFYTHRPSVPTGNITLKFLVTSRPYQDITAGFSHIPSKLPSMRLAGEESNADISREINFVICDAVERVGQEYQLDERLQDILRRRLMETPNRTYLWLHLMLEALPDLDKSTSRAFQSDINSLPQSVEQAYERILSRHSGQRTKVEALLHIIVGARRPLNVMELYVAYQMATVTPTPMRHKDLELDSAHFKSHIRHLYGLFVFINDDRIFLIHQTAKDFLVNRKGLTDPSYGLWRHSLLTRHSEAMMARLCVQYLVLEDIQDNWVFTGTNEEEKQDENDRDYPLCTYSAVYWPAHFLCAKIAENEMDRRIDSLYDMRSKRYETWTTVFWRAHYSHLSQDGIQDVHLAALNGHDDVLRRLLDSTKGRLDVQDGDYRTPLLWASLNGHEVVVQTLLDKHAKFNIPCGSVGAALQAASQGGHKEIVALLLSKGADVNMQSDKFPSALYTASRRGFSEIVAMLLDKGAYVNTQCSKIHANFGTTGSANTSYCNSHRNVDNGLYATLKRRLQSMAPVKKPDVDLSNPLLAAVSEGHSNIVRMLLNHGADISKWGGIALLIAIFRGSDDIVRMLLDRGVDVNMLGEDGNPLWTAVSHGHSNIVRLLLDKGADVNIRLGKDSNTLLGAIALGYDDIVRMLLKKGADLRRELLGSSDYYTNATIHGDALLIASFKGQETIVQLLLDEGADANGQGGQYGNVLQAASHEGHIGVINLLLSRGADINARGGTSGNALQIACREGHFEVAQALVNWGADVNAQCGIDGNALQAASLRGHSTITRMLLDRGAHVNTQECGRYSNPLQAAVCKSHVQIVEMLLDMGAEVNAICRVYGLIGAMARHDPFLSDFVNNRCFSPMWRDPVCNRYSSALQAACKRGNIKIIQMLLDRGADVIQGSQGESALHLAVESGNDEVVKMLLISGANINSQNTECNLLQLASKQGHDAIVKMLLSNGADVNAPGGDTYGTALEAASIGRHDGIVRMLLDHGANIELGCLFRSPLQAAFLGGSEAIVQQLLDMGADIRKLGEKLNNTLVSACSEGNEKIVRILLDTGPDFKTESGEDGCLALQAACQQDNEGIVRMLLDKGARINAPGKHWRDSSPLYDASKKGYSRIVKMLLDKGANPNTPVRRIGSYGNALQVAVSGGLSEVVHLLLEKGADANTPRLDEWNLTPLEEAVCQNHQEITQMLLNSGADFNAPGGRNGNVLYCACRRGYEAIVRTLLNKGANVNIQSHTLDMRHVSIPVRQEEYCSTYPLEAAVASGYEKIVQMLLERGADVNVPSSKHGNVLQSAVSGGNPNIVQMLLDVGANVNAQGGESGDALYIAMAGNKTEIAQMLLKRGADVRKDGNALYLASLNGNETAVRMILDKGGDINAHSNEGRDAFWAASSRGYDKIIRILLDEIPVSNFNRNQLLDGFCVASERGYDTIVCMLLDELPDAVFQAKQLPDAVYAASKRGYDRIIRMLLHKHADPNAPGGEDSNALQAASHGGHNTTVQALLQAGADVNRRCGHFGDALQAASYGGHSTTVRILLEAGANVNARHGYFGSCLSAASHGGHDLTVRLLLDAGADVKSECGHFGDALQAACSGGRNTTVRILLGAGANVDARCGHFGGALPAASHGGHDATVRILLKAASADAGVHDDLLSISLQAAISKGHTKVMATLLREGAHLSVETEQLGDILQCASTRGYDQIVKMLLYNKKSIEVKNKDLAEALYSASRGGHIHIVDMLLNRGVDITTHDQARGGALYAASEEGHTTVVQLLLEKGADVNAIGGHFGNPLQAASSKGHERIAQMLLDRGADICAPGGHCDNSLLAALRHEHDSIFQMLLEKCVEERTRKRKAEDAVHGVAQRRRRLSSPEELPEWAVSEATWRALVIKKFHESTARGASAYS